MTTKRSRRKKRSPSVSDSDSHSESDTNSASLSSEHSDSSAHYQAEGITRDEAQIFFGKRANQCDQSYTFYIA